MYLKEIFEQLMVGELANLSMGGVNEEGIHECDYPKIIPHINLGLVELYKRFPIKMNEVVIQQFDHIQTYVLDSKYAITNKESREPTKYIIDSIYQPFTDDVLKIEKVFNELGEQLYLNDFEEYFSVHTPVYNTVQIPYPDRENQCIISYRAKHVHIPSDHIDPKSVEIDIPYSLVEPLLNFIGYRVNMNTAGDDRQDSDRYLQRFEMTCKKIEELKLIDIVDNTENSKLRKAGWV